MIGCGSSTTLVGESKKSDWLDLDAALIRETTRFGEKKLHVRNLGDFRKLRRENRFAKAEQKLKELRDDENSVIGYASEPGNIIAEPKGPKLTHEEALDLLGTAPRLKYDVLRLLDALSGSTGDINALWRVIKTASLIGRFMGEHPHLRKKRTAPATDKRKTRLQKRREIVAPLALAVRKSHPKWTPNRIATEIWSDVNNQLEKKHQVEQNTIYDDVNAILKKLDVRT